jgi:hypothetical protein
MLCQVKQESEPDKTEVSNYVIALSERDVKYLVSLESRNGGGTTIGGENENIAVWKMVNQVCDFHKANEGLDNYD